MIIEKDRNEEKTKNDLEMNERFVILLIIANVMVFVMMAILNIILREINDLLKNIKECMENINDIIYVFKKMISS